MPEIGIGIVGGGYMGKAHAVAMSAVGAVFDTALRPRLEMVCASTPASAERYRAAYGFARATDDWRRLVEDPKVGAVIIASPQDTHRAIAEAAFALGKPVFCEKPLGASLAEAEAMTAAAEAAGVPSMIGFNYVRTPATQFARQLIAEGAIGEVTWFRGEHTEDFLADPATPANWRTKGMANGTMGDLAPHMINAALALLGPIAELSAVVETVHATRPGADGPEAVTNDDHAQIMCRFAKGAQGHLYFSRIATGVRWATPTRSTAPRGPCGSTRRTRTPSGSTRPGAPRQTRGFRKILTGPAHPDYRAFCQGPGHGTGYQDQIIIEARDFLSAIATGEAVWPTFRDGLAVWQVVETALLSARTRSWHPVPS
jgi:predicted dehydrogenase